MRELERKIGAVCRKVARDVASGKRGAPHRCGGTWTTTSARPPTLATGCAAARRVGVVTGLAWTPVGGKILYIEGVSLPSGNGSLKLTGQLGSVMQESASAAFSYLRSRFGAQAEHARLLPRATLHIHMPAGRGAQGRPERRHRHGDGDAFAAACGAPSTGARR